MGALRVLALQAASRVSFRLYSVCDDLSLLTKLITVHRPRSVSVSMRHVVASCLTKICALALLSMTCTPYLRLAGSMPRAANVVSTIAGFRAEESDAYSFPAETFSLRFFTIPSLSLLKTTSTHSPDYLHTQYNIEHKNNTKQLTLALTSAFSSIRKGDRHSLMRKGQLDDIPRNLG